MTPEQQRIAIAEFCGFTAIRFSEFLQRPILIGFHPTLKVQQAIPDYLNDLNAMHEAVEHLSEEEQYDYSQNLMLAVGLNPTTELMGLDLFNLAYATAAKRAEALLRTIGKWV